MTRFGATPIPLDAVVGACRLGIAEWHVISPDCTRDERAPWIPHHDAEDAAALAFVRAVRGTIHPTDRTMLAKRLVSPSVGSGWECPTVLCAVPLAPPVARHFVRLAVREAEAEIARREARGGGASEGYGPGATLVGIAKAIEGYGFHITVEKARSWISGVLLRDHAAEDDARAFARMMALHVRAVLGPDAGTEDNPAPFIEAWERDGDPRHLRNALVSLGIARGDGSIPETAENRALLALYFGHAL